MTTGTPLSNASWGRVLTGETRREVPMMRRRSQLDTEDRASSTAPHGNASPKDTVSDFRIPPHSESPPSVLRQQGQAAIV
eukprot:CAMPEP_0175836444 /NCGR_PEP_ID=MMETSP0107_2-20121207/17144_1 /TAXON_ID=195067 ORGANISM="Goniomonas pacifica, Strain CCMP1869" /NCGR_SAMPLE_ID=MMETSP0107_2 /ASSEMBLY_ACC=CAM_ASM_000203 /LENGTH=79 /DNA_ID=CAMNT_0017149835 /DNA_START=188 /DNA_END=428 /DNA_ORIENTATION=+